MAKRIRCRICFKIIDCAPYDTAVLLNHIRSDHPDIELPEEELEDLDDEDEPPTVSEPYRSDRVDTGPSDVPHHPQPEPGGDMEEETIRNIDGKPIYTRKYKVRSRSMARSPQKRRLYKTSIEKWRPAKGTIYCPKCGCNKRPIIRSRTEKMSYSSAGAICIMTCWPLCFLPCLFPSPTRDYLHCAECNNFLGMYDKQNNCIRPNRDFVEECKSKSSERLSRASDRQTEEPCASTSLTDLQGQPKQPVPPASEKRKEDSAKTTAVKTVKAEELRKKMTEKYDGIADSITLVKGRSVGIQFPDKPL